MTWIRDCATAPELITALDAIVARGSIRLVLDFSGLEFFGAAGWHLVADVARRLESLNRSVEVVSASELTARVFEICDPTGTIAVTLSSSSAAARDGGGARYRDDGPRHGRERMLNSKGSER